MPAETLRDMCKSPWRARQVHEGGEIGTGLDCHAHECRFAQRVTQLSDKVSQSSCIKWSRYDRAPARAGAGDIAVGVADAITVFELERGILREERDHPGAASRNASTLASLKLLPSTSRR
jgi:hypothetical protein